MQLEEICPQSGHHWRGHFLWTVLFFVLYLTLILRMVVVQLFVCLGGIFIIRAGFPHRCFSP